MVKFRYLMLACVAFTACRKDPLYCPGAPKDNCNLLDGSVNTEPSGCTGDPGCAAPTPVCELAAGTCVQCTAAEPGACTGTSPVCGSDNACHGCAAHTDCADSHACLPDGSCAAAADVAYVAPGGSGAACTATAPCGTLDAGLTTARPYVKIATGLVKDNKTTVIDGQAVTILADPGAKLDRDGDGAVLEVESANATVQIYDLEITGASGAAGADGVQLTPNGGTPSLTLTRVTIDGNQGLGIETTGGSLTLTRSTIANNTGGGLTTTGGSLTLTRSTIADNAGGGLSLSATQFTIENNFIASNGSGSSGLGGVKLDGITTSGTHQLDFNTITANLGPATVNTGINCGTVTVPLVFSNNIVYANLVAGGGKQLGGSVNCTATYSDVGPDTTAGTGNVNSDPLFVDVNAANYHITSSSPAKDSADSAATLDIDFDGDSRPQGPARDMGADEVTP
ncbi:MAG TPA: right-handed parallel beta-helix repeat-containing protein [Kofleriaceae bacterium]|jgi:hypothetical protein